MNRTLTDDDLSRALSTAAASYPEVDPVGLQEEARRVGNVLPLQRRRGVQLLSLAAAVVVGALLTASITSGSQSDKQIGARASATEGFDSKSGGTGGLGGTTGTTGGFVLTVPQTVRGVAQAPKVGTGSVPGTGNSASAASAASVRIVQIGSISLVVDDGKVAQAMINLRLIASRVHGYVASQQSQAVGDNPSGTITLRVPVASFEAVVKEITGKGFGAKVVSSESSGQDVTAEYADTAAQIATLKAARTRYLTILNAAKTVGEILSVQQRVDEVQGQIDRLEGARRVLANQSDLATLAVSVNEKAGAELVVERSGWSKAWYDAGHGFTSGVESLIAHSGRALLVLLVAVLVLLVARSGWRLARRRLI